MKPVNGFYAKIPAGRPKLLNATVIVENPGQHVTYFGAAGREMGQLVKDQFDVLYAEGADNARVLPICLHTFIAGQPFRWKHLAAALDYIVGHDHVWLATGGEINDWYRANHC